MRYYVQEIPYESQNKGAWGKAHSDVNTILSELEYAPLYIYQDSHKGLRRYFRQFTCLKQWKRIFSGLTHFKKRGENSNANS